MRSRGAEAIRVVLGILVAAAGALWLPAGFLAVLAWGTGAVLAATAVIGWCPMCAMVGRKPVDASR